MTTPHTDLFVTHSGGWHQDSSNQYSFRYVSTDTTTGKYLCRLYKRNPYSALSGHDIEFDPNTGVWSDVGGNNPAYFTTTSTFAATTSVTGYPVKIWAWASNQVGLDLEFSTPLWAQQSAAQQSGGGGTSTEGVTTPEISMTHDQLIGSGWAAGTYSLRGPLGVHPEAEQPGYVDASIVVTSNGEVLYNGPFVDGLYEFQNFSWGNSFEQFILRTRSKKVYCNFW